MSELDMAWAREIDAGEITETELVSRILDDALPFVVGLVVDVDKLARRITDALGYTSFDEDND